MRLNDPRPRSRLGRTMVAASARINYEWALRRPGQPPFLILTEFPRSGGNWIRDMLSDALQIPAPRFSRLPITFRAIIHNHDHRATSHPTVYVIRDPRDVFASHFHKTVATWFDAPPSLRRRIARYHPSLLQLRSVEEARSAAMISFYSEWSKRGLGVRVPWKEHIRGFIGTSRPSLTIIRYEDMQSNPVEALTRALTELTTTLPASDVIEFAVARNEFGRQTGRAAGTVDNTATRRQGTAGAWREALPPEIKAQFARDLANELALAGYGD